jgi:hypothetical protein
MKTNTKKTKNTKKIELEKMPIQTIKCIPVSYLIPTSLGLEVWEKISDAPFSWGDNNHSLVSPIDFAVHCEEKLDDIKYKKLLKKIRSIPQDVYIDLEN